jgi:hypothetical protein
MKMIRNTFLLGVLVTVPGMGMAQTPPAKSAPASAVKPATAAPAAAKAPAAKPAVVRATKGVVKSVDASSLVITGSGAKAKELTFVLNSATVKTGTLAVGATVQVRYKTEAKQNIATAVSVSEKNSDKKK